MLGEGGVGSQLGRWGRDYVEEPKRQSAAARGVSRRARGGGVSHDTGVGGQPGRQTRERVFVVDVTIVVVVVVLSSLVWIPEKRQQ